MRRARGAAAVAVLLACAVAPLSCDTVGGPFEGDGPLDSFMFHVFGAGHEEILGPDFAGELKDDLAESLAWTAPPYFWSEIEPVDDAFDWTELDGFVAGNSDRHRVINLGPEFMPEDGGFSMAGDPPGWIENSHADPEFREQFGQLVTAIVGRYAHSIDMWWIGLEVNLGGDGLDWAEWKEWLAWQVDLIREQDADARIAISFGSWTDYHEQIPANAVHEIDGANELVADGVEFDVIAIEYHYGTLQEGDLGDLFAAVDDLKTVGKDVFIWEVFYPAATDPAHQEQWSWVKEPAEGYSEEWQAEQLLGTLTMAYEDPRVIGINILHFQDITYGQIAPDDWEAGWRCNAGVVRADGSPRESYHDVRDYWHAISGR